MESLERTLAQHPFLAGLDRRYPRQLAALASSKSFEAHQVLFYEGQAANEFYLILKGKVGIETALLGCESIVIQTLGPGEVLGWSWLLPPYQWHYSARALEPTEMIALDGKTLRTKCEEDHDLGYEMMKRFALVIVQRLAATRSRSLNFPDPVAAPEVPDPSEFRGRGE
ncbi:MAG TPA: cyclic nucleotide-binding domain-containing protein [Gemmataceae bacterium]|nr:cyclic nucleotide-binding domain-containing protein [Gemmataceae bacterium]